MGVGGVCFRLYFVFFCFVVFRKERKMALIQLASTEEAINALVVSSCIQCGLDILIFIFYQ